MEFTPPNAPAVVILFLATALLLFSGGVVAAGLAMRGRRRPARRVVEAMAVILVIYFGALLTHSLTSKDLVLEPGQLKYFCEVDCHLAYSVEGVRSVKSVGSGSGAVAIQAPGSFVIVSVKTWFDPNTIAPWRGDRPLRPNPRTIRLEDAAGRSYAVSAAAEKAVAGDSDARSLLARPLRPGESYTTELAFELPGPATEARLLISEDVAEASFIVSHENSLFHRKIWFRIPTPEPAGSASPDAAARGSHPADPARGS
jgi:hypothetical protein